MSLMEDIVSLCLDDICKADLYLSRGNCIHFAVCRLLSQMFISTLLFSDSKCVWSNYSFMIANFWGVFDPFGFNMGLKKVISVIEETISIMFRWCLLCGSILLTWWLDPFQCLWWNCVSCLIRSMGSVFGILFYFSTFTQDIICSLNLKKSMSTRNSRHINTHCLFSYHFLVLW